MITSNSTLAQFKYTWDRPTLFTILLLTKSSCANGFANKSHNELVATGPFTDVLQSDCLDGGNFIFNDICIKCDDQPFCNTPENKYGFLLDTNSCTDPDGGRECNPYKTDVTECTNNFDLTDNQCVFTSKDSICYNYCTSFESAMNTDLCDSTGTSNILDKKDPDNIVSPKGINELQVVDIEGLNEYCISSVSYTHLTLPTILLV